MSIPTIPRPLERRDPRPSDDVIRALRQRVLDLDTEIAQARDAVVAATAHVEALLLARDAAVWRYAELTADRDE
jgi:hypothetical protein